MCSIVESLHSTYYYCYDIRVVKTHYMRHCQKKNGNYASQSVLFQKDLINHKCIFDMDFYIPLRFRFSMASA